MHSTPPQQPRPVVSETTPRLTLSLTGWKKLSAQITSWPMNAIILTIRREEDGSNRPCILNWSPSDFNLRLYSANKGQMKEAPVAEPQDPAIYHEPDFPDPFPVNGMDVIELWPADKITLYRTLPDRYGPLLDVGRNYEILWAGGEITQWAWGAKQDHQGQDQGQGLVVPLGPKITLPSGPRWRFTAVSPHWRPGLLNQNQNQASRRSLIDPAARVSGAPVLTVTLKADNGKITGCKWDIQLRLQTKITYHGVLGDATTGPIMFYAGAAIEYESDFLLDRRRNGATWGPVTPGFFCGLGMYLRDEDLPQGFAHGQRGLFVCLRPGESWLDTLDACDYDPWEFPPDLAHGNVFRLQHKGCVINWWNWGGPEDLAAALDSFPRSGNDAVAYLTTNLDRRPKLVVPASDAIELVYEEQA